MSDRETTGGATPVHPLVIDAVTKRARLATQADIWRFESICLAYESLVEDARKIVAKAAGFEERLSDVR